MSEFIENETQDVPIQDCELKAFYRIVHPLNEAFSRLPVLLTLDALYACGPVFTLCRQKGWRYIATLTDDKLASALVEFRKCQPLHPGQRIVRQRKEGRIRTTETYTWVNQIFQCGTDGETHSVNILECTIHNEKGKRIHLFRWVTNLDITADTAVHIANHGGRIRWSTETGFKVLKKDGFRLGHVFSKHPTAAKIFHHLMLLAALFLQLIHKSDVGKILIFNDSRRRATATFRLIMEAIQDALRFGVLSETEWGWIQQKHLQIRFLDDS